ncbi:MAG TPA: hypothetical protein VNY05_01420 [Candidatus Acidoferrales bacterium]|jgi:hypothetical protein|nr:hypothetical protein [Candidatus Acidoferrales bacterium]
MIARLTSRFFRHVATLSLVLSIPVLCAGQTGVAPSNPRAPSDDPRIGLKAGVYDAGEAAFGMVRIVSLPKPPGFAPGPGGTTEPFPAPQSADIPPGQPRTVQYGSANSDLAFSGNHLFVGNYNGINFYDIDSPAKTTLKTSLMCPGGQGDVSVYGHLLFMSAEAMNGRTDCGTQGIPLPAGYKPPPPPPPLTPEQVAAGARPPRVPPPPSPDRFRGVRIFDIGDLANPKQVAAVQSCRGSHTHTLVIDPKDKENVYIYISGTGLVRQSEEVTECSDGDPSKNPETALFRIDIIKVPLAHPEKAAIVASPRIFTDAQTGALNGLWKGGSHGEGTQSTSETNRCHDITVYSAVGLAAGACSGNGILLNISDPVHPVRIDAVSDPNYAFWHSASFNNAGTKVMFTDEWGGGTQPRCRATDPMNWGADAIFNLSNGKLTLASYYKMPAAQTETENCVAHNGSLVPIPGRDIVVQAWYQGGISMVDFTDAAHPIEIAYFDRGPLDKEKKILGGFWSVYWYNGYLYGSEIARGVDVLKLVPSKFVTQNEIDAANQVHFDELNVQNQPKITWPSNFVVGRAYLDQLARSGALAPERVAALSDAIAKGEASHSAKEAAALKTLAASLDKDAATAKSPADAERMRALSGIMNQGGASLR